MTQEVLTVRDDTDEQSHFEIYLNAHQRIYIGNVNTEDDPMRQVCITFSKEDWEVIKRFVNKQFSYLDK